MKLKIYLILILALMVSGIRHCKNIVQFDGMFYHKEFLADGTVSKPFFMTFLPKTNQILFSEDSEPFGNTNTVILDLKTKELINVNLDKAVVNGVSDNGTIFIGQDGGLFVLNENTMALTETAIKDVILYSMLITGNIIYYTNYPKRDVYVYKDDEVKLYKSDLNIYDLTFDRDNNFYYFNKTGIYVKYANDTDAVNIEALEYDEVPLVGLMYDKKRNAVFATSVYGVFKVDLEKKNLKRISMKTMFDITFDADDNIIYSDEESIVRLRETNTTC